MVVMNKTKRAKARLDTLHGKLTSEQQYEKAHGTQKDETSLWMTALAQGEIDRNEVNEAKTVARGVSEANNMKAPSWALKLDEFDSSGDAMTEESYHRASIASGISTYIELSDEAKEWKRKKEERETQKATAKAAREAAQGADMAGDAVLPAPLGAVSAMEIEAEAAVYEEATAMAKAHEQEWLEKEAAAGDDVRLWEKGWKER